MNIKETVKNLPLTSGVYLYKDAAGAIIYIGKAVNLRRRVESYFRPNARTHKTDLLVEHISDIEVIKTESEAEALILEASLVRRHMPKYNVQLKDGKTYPFIQITDEPYPLVRIIRINQRKFKNIPGDLYGPYVNAYLIKEALALLRKIFPFRACEPFKDKLCLDYHIGLCSGPCEGKISKEAYRRNIRRIRMVLEGDKDGLYKQLRQDMEDFAKEKHYEEAAQVRDQLRAIGALYSGSGDPNKFKEAEQLKRALSLDRPINRIECFDISNIMGSQAVGSMVSFLNGAPDKNNYRRFRIKTVEGIDDFKMMAEVVRRRYTRLKEEGALFPDLVLIDGGKGQLGAAVAELKKLNVNVPVASLAKREEELFLPGKRNPIVLPKDSLGLNLVMRVRDEAHRFAVSYHRFLRGKAVLGKGNR